MVARHERWEGSMCVYKRVPWGILWWWNYSMWMNECEYLGCDIVPIVLQDVTTGGIGQRIPRLSLHHFLQFYGVYNCFQRKIQQNMVFQGYYYIGKCSYYNMWKSKIWKYSLSNDKFRECIYLYMCWVMYILCTYTYAETQNLYLCRA